MSFHDLTAFLGLVGGLIWFAIALVTAFYIRSPVPVIIQAFIAAVMVATGVFICTMGC